MKTGEARNYLRHMFCAAGTWAYWTGLIVAVAAFGVCIGIALVLAAAFEAGRYW